MARTGTRSALFLLFLCKLCECPCWWIQVILVVSQLGSTPVLHATTSCWCQSLNPDCLKFAACSISDYCRGGLESLQCNNVVVTVILRSDAVYVTNNTVSHLNPEMQMSPSIPPFDEYEARRCCRGPHDAFKWMLKMQTAPEDTAAIIIEPILGEGGFVAPPPDFLSTLRKHCDEHNIVMIIDEVTNLLPLHTVMCSRMKS